MNLSKLFVIALLAGTLGVIGCSDDDNGGTGGTGTGGTGGGGGTVTDPCTGGFCDDPSEAKTACGVAIEYCKSDDCCSGAGGAGGAVDPTDDQCNALGPKICMIDFGGAGGAGGAGGGTAAEVCDQCDVPEQAPDCETRYDSCIANPPSGVNPQEKCAVAALEVCGGF
jgi:hypothetical protein